VDWQDHQLAHGAAVPKVAMAFLALKAHVASPSVLTLHLVELASQMLAVVEKQHLIALI
jgi:hypothetical protein